MLKLECAKNLIKEKKFDDALKILNEIYLCVLPECHEQICLEIGKVYMETERYDEAVDILIKITNDKNIVDIKNKLIFKIYTMINQHDKVLDMYFKIKLSGILILDEIKVAINSAIILKKYKLALEIANDSKFDKINEQIYREISIYIQNLNKNDKYNEAKEIFNEVYQLIPEEQKKIKNILLNEYEMIDGRLFLESKPRVVTVNLTSKCNLRCIMCYTGFDRKEQKLSDKHCDELLELIPYMERLILQGGEVFLYPRFDELLKKVCDSSVLLEIVTNGLLLNRTRIKKLIDINSEITFSIDGFTKSTYEYIRIGSNFEHLIDILEYVSEYKKYKENNAITRLQMVVMKSNYKEIELAFDFAEKYNFNEIILIPIKSEKNIINDEYIFDVAFNENIVDFLESQSERWTKIAENKGIVFKNYIPTMNFYSNLKYKNKKNILPKTPKKFFDIHVLKSIKKYSQHVGDSNFIKLFCFAPWKMAYFTDNIILPTCFCPCKDDNYINSLINLIKKIFCKKHESSLLDYWNSENMLYYRKAVLLNRYEKTCNKICIDEITSCVLKKNIV